MRKFTQTPQLNQDFSLGTMENLINATQAADHIGVSLTTLADWCRRGLVPGATKLGNMWLIPIASLERIERPKMGRPASKDEKSPENA